MHFGTVSEFLAMGGHGLYVWLSYGVTLLVMIAGALLPLLHKRQILREQAQRLRREEANS